MKRFSLVYLLFSFSIFHYQGFAQGSIPIERPDIRSNPTVAQTIVFPDLVICEGEIATLDAGSCGYDAFIWNEGLSTAPTLDVTVGGIYTVEVFYGNFSYFKEFNVIVNPVPLITMTGDDYVCFGETSMLTVTPGFSTYQWSNASGPIDGATSETLEVTESGQYTVVVGNEFNCFSEASLAVVVGTELNLEIESTETCAASGSASVLVTGGKAPYSYAWSNGATTGTITDLPMGDYDLTVTDAENCTASTSVSIADSDYCAIPWIAHCGYEYNDLNTVIQLHSQVPDALRYYWVFTDLEGNVYSGWQNPDGPYFNLTEALTSSGDPMHYDDIYEVYVQVEYKNAAGEVVLGPPGPSCEIILGNPKTRPWIAHCGYEYNNINTNMTLRPFVVGALEYRWTFVDGDGIEYYGYHDPTNLYLNLQDVATSGGNPLHYDETYQVFIEVKYQDKFGNIVWGNRSGNCSITLGNPKNGPWIAHCGYEYHDLNTNLAIQQPPVVGAIEYKWTFTDASGVEYYGFQDPANLYINLQNIATTAGVPLHYDEVYQVYVEVKYEDKFGNIVYGAPGRTCDVTLGNPQTGVWIAHCGYVYNNLNTNLTLRPFVIGALEYKWTFVSGSGIEYYGYQDPANLYLNLRDVSTLSGEPLHYNDTYQVSIEVKYEDKNGDLVFGDAPGSCEVILGEPITRVWTGHCGLEFNTLNTNLLILPKLDGILQYKWVFLDASGVEYTGWQDSSEEYFNLEDALTNGGQQMSFNQTYQVHIEAEYLNELGNVVLGPTGPSCSIVLGTESGLTDIGSGLENLQFAHHEEFSGSSLEIRAFPNPAGKGKIQLAIDGPQSDGPIRLEVTDAAGHLLYEIPNLLEKSFLDTSEWKSGLYYFYCIGFEYTQVLKVIVK